MITLIGSFCSLFQSFSAELPIFDCTAYAIGSEQDQKLREDNQDPVGSLVSCVVNKVVKGTANGGLLVRSLC